MKFIDYEEVLIFHKKIIAKTGGSDGVRDKGLIESALNKPFQTFDGEDLYKDDIDKITAVTYSLVSNHGFIDGNKRIGIAVMLLLLKLNSLNIDYTQDSLIELGLGIASGRIKEFEIKKWINEKLEKKA